MKNKISEFIAVLIGMLVVAFIVLCFAAITKVCIKILFEDTSIHITEFTTEDYTVSNGETFWDIAAEHKKDGQDIREYIYELRKINNIDDCIIHPNQVIKIIK